jgi:hypothetical protein
MSSSRAPRYLRSPRFVAALIVVTALAGGATFVLWSRVQELVREEAVRRMEEHFHGTAKLESLAFSLFPAPRLTGREVVLRHEGRTDIPPLIRIARFTADLTPWGLLADPIRIDRVVLEGLEIQITSEEDDGSERPEPEDDKKDDPTETYAFVVGQVTADGTRLAIHPVDGDPQVFVIRKLDLETLAPDQAMEFEAELANAKPPGRILSTGRFGPWNAEDPGGTPVQGDYRFDEADLSVFNGLSGTLSSTGVYAGHLSRIEIDGSTDTPDFRVGEGQAVHLTTDFHAIVDGTSGDTLLEPVKARFLKTTVTARGVVEWAEGAGKAISLDVTLDQARIEDLIALVLAPDEPLVTGDIRVKTDFRLPAGERDVIDRLWLDGEFSLDSAEFGGDEARSRIEEMSWRARGRPDEDEDPVDRVVSDLGSRFVMEEAKIRFEGLTFEVPGAQALLEGTHDLHRETLDFKGKLRMDAKVSEAVGGFKSIFLKLVDPFFRSGGEGTVISIKVDGTIDDPNFGVDW